MRENGWDGFERRPGAGAPESDGHGLVALLEKLRAKLPGRRVALDRHLRADQPGRVPVSPDTGWPRSGTIVDLVQLMTYDLHGPTWSGPGPIGDLRWTRELRRSGAPRGAGRSKLDVGVGRLRVHLARGQGTGHTVAVKGARRLVEEDGATAEWRPAPDEWTATLSNGTVLWWSDKDSLDARRALAADEGLHGVAVWRLGSADTFQAPDGP